MENQIKNIVFDVGNVLIDFCWKKTCEMLHFSTEVVLAFEKNMVLSDVWDRLDEGTISQEEAIIYFISRMPEYEKEIRLFWNHADSFVEEYDYSFSMIKELKDKGYQVYLLSNYPLEMYQLHWHTFRFFKLVDGYIVSAVEKMRKPDVAIYRLLCDRYQLEPAQCMFFDDRMENVDAAIQAGMYGELFRGEQSVRERIRKMEIS